MEGRREIELMNTLDNDVTWFHGPKIHWNIRNGETSWLIQYERHWSSLSIVQYYESHRSSFGGVAGPNPRDAFRCILLHLVWNCQITSQPLTVVNSRGQSKIIKFGELELRNHSETFAIDRTHEYCMYTKYEGHRSTLVGFPRPKHWFFGRMSF